MVGWLWDTLSKLFGFMSLSTGKFIGSTFFGMGGSTLLLNNLYIRVLHTPATQAPAWQLQFQEATLHRPLALLIGWRCAYTGYILL
jgi:hypothetical protein